MRTMLLPLLLVAVTATGCATEVIAGDDVASEAPMPVAGLPDGAHVGRLVAVTTDPATVTIDPVTWVSDDAEPNGYRIEDPEQDPVDVAIADRATLEVLRSTGDPATAETVSIEDLLAWFVDLGQPDDAPLFDVLVVDGEVASLQFRYRP